MKSKRVTGTLPLHFADPAKVLHTSLPREEQAVRILCLVLALLVVGYVTLVSMSIVNVIASKEAADEMTGLRASVSELEHDYFELSETVTAQSGTVLGLAPVQKTNYVSRAGAVGAAFTARNDI